MFECRPIGREFYETAPQRFVFERELNTDPAGLFAILEDENSWPVWVSGITKVEWTTPRPFEVGTQRTVTFPGGMQVFETFFLWDVPNEMAFHLHGATQKVWFAFGELYQVTDLGDGRSKLRWTVAYEPRYVFKVIHPLIKWLMRITLGSYMDGLVKYVNAQKVGAAA